MKNTKLRYLCLAKQFVEHDGIEGIAYLEDTQHISFEYGDTKMYISVRSMILRLIPIEQLGEMAFAELYQINGNKEVLFEDFKKTLIRIVNSGEIVEQRFDLVDRMMEMSVDVFCQIERSEAKLLE